MDDQNQNPVAPQPQSPVPQTPAATAPTPQSENLNNSLDDPPKQLKRYHLIAFAVFILYFIFSIAFFYGSIPGSASPDDSLIAFMYDFFELLLIFFFLVSLLLGFHSKGKSVVKSLLLSLSVGFGCYVIISITTLFMGLAAG